MPGPSFYVAVEAVRHARSWQQLSLALALAAHGRWVAWELATPLGVVLSKFGKLAVGSKRIPVRKCSLRVSESGEPSMDTDWWDALEEALDEATARFSPVVSSSWEMQLDEWCASHPGKLAVLDADFRYVALSEGMASWHGVSSMSHRGRELREVVGDIADVVEPVVRHVLEHRVGRDVVITGALPGERCAVHHVTYMPIELEGEVLCAALVQHHASSESSDAVAVGLSTACDLHGEDSMSQVVLWDVDEGSTKVVLEVEKLRELFVACLSACGPSKVAYVKVRRVGPWLSMAFRSRVMRRLELPDWDVEALRVAVLEDGDVQVRIPLVQAANGGEGLLQFAAGR